ncbi:hypothetical protein ES707_21956 [subsurface metagenome]
MPEIAEICARHRVKHLEVFGSAAEGMFNPPASDIDFLVKFEPMTPVEHAGAYFSPAEDPDHLFGRPVDLIEQSAIRNPFFRQSIEKTTVVVYAAA